MMFSFAVQFPVSDDNKVSLGIKIHNSLISDVDISIVGINRAEISNTKIYFY